MSIMQGVRIQELEMNIERAQMVGHNIYEIENFYPTIVDKQFKDKLDMRLTEIVASNIDFVIASLAPVNKQYTSTEINEMKEKVENIYKLSKNNQPSTYFYSLKHSKIRGIEYGRLFSKESLQGLKREIRNTIVDKQSCMDIDMVNAHPCIMNQVASLLHVNAPVLNEYVTDRERLLRTIGTDCHESAKEIPLAILNGGIRSSLHPTISWLKGLEDEIQNIYKAFIQTQIGSEISADVHRRDPDNYNKLGSTLNLLLCKIENEILSQCVFYCQSKNIEVYTLCFDGFIASRTDDSILAELENHVYTTLGLRMRFSIKSFDKCLSDDLIQQLLNISNTIYPINMTKCESAFDAMTKKMRDSLFDNKIDSGFVRKKYGMKLFPFEVIIKDHIIRWLERVYGLSEIDLHFDGKNLIFKANQRKGKKYQCFCLKPNCHLIGDVIFHILWNGMHAVIAQCTFAPHCDKYVDITGALAIKKNVLSQLNNELFDASRELVQSVYTMPGVHVLQHTDCSEIDMNEIQSNIIIQTGYAGYGKTTNVFNYIKSKSENDNLICVIISNLAVQNTNYCQNTKLHSYNNEIKPVIHCMGYNIKDQIQKYRNEYKYKDGSDAKYKNTTEYPYTGKMHTYVINCKSLQDSRLLPKIDILFIDENIQVLKSVCNPTEARTYSLFNELINLIRISKKIFICDIKFDIELINLIRLVRTDHITHYKICDTRMKYKKILLTDDAILLAKLIKSKDKAFVSCDSRHFIEWLRDYYISELEVDQNDIVMIVGKDSNQSVEARLKEIKLLLKNTERKKYILCSPAVNSSIDIFGERIVIGIRFFDIISKSDSINAVLRARDGTDIYFFNFARDYKRGYLSESTILTNEDKCANRMIRNDERGVRFEETMSETVFKDVSFDCYYTYGPYRKNLTEHLGYEMASTKNPYSQAWISNRYGLNLIDPTMLSHVMNTVIQDLTTNGKNPFKFEKHYNQITFEFENNTDKSYIFKNFESIIKYATDMSTEFKQGVDSYSDEELHYQLRPKYPFLYDFYEAISGVWEEFTRTVKQNLSTIVGTGNFTQSHITDTEQQVSKQNLQIANFIGKIKDSYTPLLAMQTNDNIHLSQFINEIYKLYNLQINDISAKSIVRIQRKDDIDKLKNEKAKAKYEAKINASKKAVAPKLEPNIQVKTFDCITNHTKSPFNKLNKDRYEHDEILQFMREENIPESSHALHNLLGYQFISQQTRLNGNNIRRKTLIKISKSDIIITLFEKNE